MMTKRTTTRRRCRKAALLTSLALLCVLGCRGAALAQNSPTGPAGGDLSGTYPNPTLAADRVRKTGDTVTGTLDVRIANTGNIPVPFSLSSPGNPLLNRGVAMTFNVPGGGSATLLGGQVTSAWGGNSQTYMAFSAYNGSAMAEVFRLDGRGYVGVGTANPTAKLHVMSGTDSATTMLSLDTGTHGGTAMSVGGTVNNESTFDMSVYRAGTYVSRFGVSSAGNVYIQPGSGGVGIGTTTPGAAYKLDVAGSVNATGLCLGDGCKTLWSQVGGGGTSQWTTAGTSVYYSGGSVGIGTATPHSMLEIMGSTFFGTLDGAEVTATDGSAMAQNVGGSISFAGKYDTAGDYAGFARILGVKENATSGNYAGALVFQTRVNGGNQTEYMRITSAGNVGVGTSTPLSGLSGNAGMEVYSASAVTTLRLSTGVAGRNNSQIRFAGTSGDNWAVGSDVATNNGSRDLHFYDFAGTPGARVTLQSATGNVGIGTASPGGLLHLALSSQQSAIKFSGKRFFDGVDGGSDGVAILHYYSAAGNRQVMLADSTQTSSTTVPGFRVVVGGAYTQLDSVTPSGANVKNLVINPSGGNVGIGSANPTHTLEVGGTINATGAITGGSINATYQDVAEWVPSSQKLSAGTVVILDTDHANQVLASTKSYDTKVAGVVSAQPGISLGQGGEGKLLVATTGRVKVRVDATRAPIKVGDLLVTSDEEGVAMKSIPVDLGGTQIHRPGTIIGKALEPLEKGTGEILVLLSLQ